MKKWIKQPRSFWELKKERIVKNKFLDVNTTKLSTFKNWSYSGWWYGMAGKAHGLRCQNTTCALFKVLSAPLKVQLNTNSLERQRREGPGGWASAHPHPCERTRERSQLPLRPALAAVAMRATKNLFLLLLLSFLQVNM